MIWHIWNLNRNFFVLLFGGKMQKEHYYLWVRPAPPPPGVFRNRIGEEKAAFYINQMC